ncbi:MAG: prolipoprotein diacylglyceryl transferase [Xanthomonadales bacterium]|jgi:phosphatidylglycerol:prolipoprotein diacylglycerol transferase|nr:prolipoprotein diacylglyceryl transferase [Xanthomonadales bacterium]
MEHPYLVQFDPIALDLGPLQVHWYGVTYLVAFLGFWLLAAWLSGRRPWMGWDRDAVGDFLFYGMLGVILGGRLGYVFFYSFDSLLADPLMLVRVWDGGMSFHGGLLGLIAASAWFARKTGRSFWQVADFIAPIGPLGLACGRIGNFIGGELWGRLSDAPWAMIFPAPLPSSVTSSLTQGGLQAAWEAGLLDAYARHPSQLYQAALEGLLLFALLMLFAARPRPLGAISGLFLLGYGVFRFIVEFFREPDAHLGYLAGDWLTMGMLLSLPMVLAGAALFIWAYRRNVMPTAENN